MLLWPLRAAAGSRRCKRGRHARRDAAHEHQNAVLLDVREAKEFTGGKLPNAVHIPLSQLKDRAGELAKSTVAARDRVLRPRPARRAARGALLGTHGLQASVYVLRGGFKAWRDAGLPTGKPDAPRLRLTIATKLSDDRERPPQRIAAGHDVLRPRVPVLRPRRAPAHAKGVTDDRQDPRRPRSGAARGDDGSARAGARCRRSTSANATSAATTTWSRSTAPAGSIRCSRGA